MKVEVSQIERSTLGLREVLFRELDSLIAGKSNPERTTAVAKASCQIINTAKLELAYARFKLSLSLQDQQAAVPAITLGNKNISERVPEKR